MAEDKESCANAKPWHRLRDRGIQLREEMLQRVQESRNPLGFVLGRTAQQVLATDCANTAAELAEATFLECARWMYAETSSEDEAIFEHTVNQMVARLPMQAADLWRAVTANVSLEEDPFPLYGKREDYEEYEDSSPADLVFRKGYREINALAVRALAKDKIGIIAQKIIVDRLRGRIKIDMPLSAFHYEERDEAKFAEDLAEAIRVEREGVAAPAVEHAGKSSPESKAQEIEHPKAGGSGKTAAAKEYEVAESLYERRERESKPQWKRLREREIAIREKILEWSSEGRPISSARQGKIADWATDAWAELSEADFVDWSREEPDDLAFEERISGVVGCCQSIGIVYLWWRLVDMVELAHPHYLAPTASRKRARTFKTYEEQRASEEDYRSEVECAIRGIADDKLRVVAQKVILRRFKGEIPYEPPANQTRARKAIYAEEFLETAATEAAEVDKGDVAADRVPAEPLTALESTFYDLAEEAELKRREADLVSLKLEDVRMRLAMLTYGSAPGAQTGQELPASAEAFVVVTERQISDLRQKIKLIGQSVGGGSHPASGQPDERAMHGNTPTKPATGAPTMPAMPIAKSQGRAGRRGRPGNPERHRDIAAIALKYGEGWPDRLQDVCTRIDAAKIAPRYTENWKETWLATLDQPRGPEIIKKAIHASVDAANKA